MTQYPLAWIACSVIIDNELLYIFSASNYGLRIEAFEIGGKRLLLFDSEALEISKSNRPPNKNDSRVEKGRNEDDSEPEYEAAWNRRESRIPNVFSRIKPAQPLIELERGSSEDE